MSLGPARSPEFDPAAALALRLREGDEEALAAWYTAEFGAVRRLCFGLLADPGAADDAAQEALLKLHRGLPRWDPTRPYGAWRNTVVIHHCRDHQRSAERRRGREARSARPERLDSDPAAALQAAELGQRLEAALTCLSPREREVFVLIDLEELPASEAAAQLDIAPASLRAYLSLARAKLKERLAPHYDPRGGPRS